MAVYIFEGKELYKTMAIKLRKIGEFCIVDLASNSFETENISLLKNTINEIIDQGFKHILLNMTEITRIDGTGLGTLINFQKIAFYNEINIRLYSLQPYVAEMMFQTRLNRVLDICQSEDKDLCEEALADNLMFA